MKWYFYCRLCSIICFNVELYNTKAFTETNNNIHLSSYTIFTDLIIHKNIEILSNPLNDNVYIDSTGIQDEDVPQFSIY